MDRSDNSTYRFKIIIILFPYHNIWQVDTSVKQVNKIIWQVDTSILQVQQGNKIS